jgi:GNAT superfamily N-acetyltransferase
MFTVIRASMALMNEVQACVNENAFLYEYIVDPKDLGEHHVDTAWAERNFKIREFYLARAEGEYVGAASYQKLGSFAYIGYFYIKPKCHKLGYGQQFMRFLEMRTQSDNVTDLRLFANGKANWALSFYERVGFKVLMTEKQDIMNIDNGIFKPFYEEGAYLLQKVLPKPILKNISL